MPGQQACEAKSNDITAIPLLLERLALIGALVTIGAMGCQTRIAQAILDRGGDYLLAVKDNQSSLHDNNQRAFDDRGAKLVLLRILLAKVVAEEHGRDAGRSGAFALAARH